MPNDPEQTTPGHSDAPPENLSDTKDGSDQLADLNDFSETISYRSADGPTPEVSDASNGSEVGATKASIQDSDSSSDFELSAPPERQQQTIPAAVGRYEVRSVLGQGGFGAVYQAFDAQLERHVAVKVPLLRSDANSDDFLQEARQLAQLAHPSIVTVFDVGIDHDACFIVSDFLDGDCLTDWLPKQTPSWQESARIVATLAEALAFAHARGIVHRDVKPANVIMTERTGDFVPVLVDFGLALSQHSAGRTGARRGDITGTPSYMSPEQARGEGHRIDGRISIHSASCCTAC